MTIVCNARVLDTPMTGIQRYTHEILARMPGIETIRPGHSAAGVMGHLWEQAVLPMRIGRRLLWSPCNTGPIAVRRQVVTVHDIAPFDVPAGFSASFRALYHLVLPTLLSRVEAIITVSQFTRDRLIERFGLDEARIHVTHLAVDHERFHLQDPAAIEEMRARLGLPRRYLLFVGALSARKNVTGLLRAWSRAQAQIDDDVELVIAGGAGPARVLSGTTLDQLPPRTRILGRVGDADLPLLYAGAALLTYPSLYEGFGLPVLEAMASGTPVLTSRGTSLPEVAGDAALLVDPSDLDDIADALIGFFSDPARAAGLRQAGLARAADFNWEKTAIATRGVLQSCT
jgi:glycosyltransferase involved in cell wall biosynthesis